MSATVANEDAFVDAADFVAGVKQGSLGAAVVALAWDSDDPEGLTGLAEFCHLAMLPGAHVAMFSPGRVVDRAGMALRLAGFEIRDTVAVAHDGDMSYWVLARKEPESTVVRSTLDYGTGGINIDATRVGNGEDSEGPRAPSETSANARYKTRGAVDFAATPSARGGSADGRWPPNAIIDLAAAAEMDRQAPSAGAAAPASGPSYSGESKSHSMSGKFYGMGDTPATFHDDRGGASRFFPRPGSGDGETPGFEWITRLIKTPAADAMLLCDDWKAVVPGNVGE